MEIAKAKKIAYVSNKRVFSLDISTLSLGSPKTVKRSSGSIKRRKKFSTLSCDTTSSRNDSGDNPKTYNLKDHYEIIETLGMGTYAYVRHAVNKKTDQHVAIKTSRGENSRKMLKNEYNLLKRLSEDNIVEVYDFIEHGDKNESFLIMEYFEGKNLDEYVEDNGPLSEKNTKLVIQQILDTVSSLHDLGIAHRDIKPENVLINDAMEIKLIDFNISKLFCYESSPSTESSKSKFNSVYYTQISSPLYSAPELKNSYSYTESVDMWGVGTVMFTCLYGTFSTFELGKMKSATKRAGEVAKIIKKNKK